LGRKPRRRLRPLAAELSPAHPELDDPVAYIARGVLVDGRLVDNPRSLVREGAHIELPREEPLRGEAKLHAALSVFDVEVEGRVALDLGAAAGGFTRVLLEAGAARVYSVDAGFGQLLGSLRQDPRVVVLERVNLGELDRRRVPEPVGLVTIDLSYLAVSRAASQLERIEIPRGADLIALVKPMFELGLASPPRDPARLAEALARAAAGLVACGWAVLGSIESPVTGARGAIELQLHARRAT
jgi:23S rRNA (cytidine1920-2'-O)/16S rRNA (cytidine1409-2'-O)-methyltransferase